MVAGTHDAPASSALTMELRSPTNPTQPFAPGSPMARKLRKKEEDMMAAWPAANNGTETEPDIPPTEPRPKTLDFSAIQPSDKKEFQHNTNTAADKPTETQTYADKQPPTTSENSAPEISSIPQPQPPTNSASANTDLRQTQPQTTQKSDNTDLRQTQPTATDTQRKDKQPDDSTNERNPATTPSYLQTATTGDTLNMDTIIETVLGQYQCPPSLLNTELRSSKIRSFSDLMAQYKDRYPESCSIVSKSGCSESWRNEFAIYFNKFKSRHEWLDEPATVALLMMMSNLTTAARLIVKKTWIRCVGMNSSESYSAAKRIKETGGVGDRIAVRSDLLRIDYDGLAAVTTEALCYDGSGSDAADSALHRLSNLDLSGCYKFPQIISTELESWQACYRELDEAPMANYLRMKNLISACKADKCLCAIAEAFEDVTARQKNLKLSRIKSWDEVETLFSEAWDLAHKQGKISHREIESDSSFDESPENSSSAKVSVHYATKQQEHERLRKNSYDGMLKRDVVEQKLDCRDCKQKFIDSIEDQQHRIEMKYVHDPVRCPPCKEKYLSDLAENPRPCNEFAVNGKCGYGDKCRFSHCDADAGRVACKPVSAHTAGISDDFESCSESEYSSEYDSDHF